jgi:hypothetical protein
MNRRAKRRAAKVGDVLNVNFARYVTTATSVLTCYACNKPAPPWPWPDGPAELGYGMAIIDGHLRVPLCQHCYETDSNEVARRYWRSPDLKVHEGGEINSLDALQEMADVLAEKDKSTEH